MTMKNIQIIDGAVNSVYDIFQATEDEFAVIFPDGTDVAFSDEIYDGGDEQSLIALFTKIWQRRSQRRMLTVYTESSSTDCLRKSSTIRRERTKRLSTPTEVGSDKTCPKNNRSWGVFREAIRRAAIGHYAQSPLMHSDSNSMQPKPCDLRVSAI